MMFDCDEKKPDTEKPRIYDHSPTQTILQVNKYFVKNAKKELTFEKIGIQKDDDPHLVTSRKGAPLIIYKNTMFKPSYETVKGEVVSRCDNNGKCAGKIRTNRHTGNTVVHFPCSCQDHIEEIKKKIAQRRKFINMFKKLSTQEEVED